MDLTRDTVLFVVGDASGDAYAASLAEQLKRRRPGLSLVGLGGPAMGKAGVELLADQAELAVGGLVELLPDLRGVARVWRTMGRALRERRPGLVVLVDSAGFNLPFARRARRAGAATLFYVCPQVWAWRRHRLRRLARRVDRLALILPFEADLYAAAGAPAHFVGHPLVDRLARPEATPERGSARRLLGLPAEGPVVALLPGSRRHELRHHARLYLQTARWLAARRPQLRFVLPRPSSLDPGFVERELQRAGGLEGLDLRVHAAGSGLALCAADAVLAKPGTGTLEAALIPRPLVVAGRTSALSAALVRRLVRVPWLALPNLIAGRELVPELLQEQATPERVGRAVLERLGGEGARQARDALRLVREKLGPPGASLRVADLAEELLDGPARA